MTNSLFFQIAGMSLEVSSDIDFSPDTFDSKFREFQIAGRLEENIRIHHHFVDSLEDIDIPCGENFYLKPPWSISRTPQNIIYQWIDNEPPNLNYYRTVVTDHEHTFFKIYNDRHLKKKFIAGRLTSLTMLPTDQILVGRILAYKKGCMMHSLGICIDNQGYIFIGHSGAGKSTAANLLRQKATILCDDRNIIRRNKRNFLLSGTWSHGDVTDVSSLCVPLKAVFFLEQSGTEQIEDINDESEILNRLLACLIRPLETPDWWEKSLDMLSRVVKTVPCRILKFKKTSNIFNLIKGN